VLCASHSDLQQAESAAQGRLFDFDFELSRHALTAAEGVTRSKPIHMSA
jgi:hypothetical protein